MTSKESTRFGRKLQAREKFLLGASVLAVMVLAAFAFTQSSGSSHETNLASSEMTTSQVGSQEKASPEVACQSLVKAMLKEDDAQIKRLTTAAGYSTLKRHVQSGPFNSYPALANRIIAEWGKPMYWQEDNLQASNTNHTGIKSMSRTVRPGEVKPSITLKRTSKGWVLDDYTPGPDRFIKSNSKLRGTWNLNG